MIFEEPADQDQFSEDLKGYVLKMCDLSVEDINKLREISSTLSEDDFDSRMRVLADFFHRNARSRYGKISNQLAYSKKVLLSDSFFENQKIDFSIPSVEQTQKYLEDIWDRRARREPEDPKLFHERITKIKRLYAPQETEDIESADKKVQAEKKHREAFSKMEDERLLKQLDAEILMTYKKIAFCELEYKLFRISLLNVYLYHGEAVFREFLDKLSGYENLTIKDLYTLRDSMVPLQKDH